MVHGAQVKWYREFYADNRMIASGSGYENVIAHRELDIAKQTRRIMLYRINPLIINEMDIIVCICTMV